MNNLNQETELRRQYKVEADEILFDNLNFDARMKERVLRSIQTEHKLSVWKKRFGQGRRKWIYSITTAGFVVIVFLSIIPNPGDWSKPSTLGNNEENPSVMHKVDDPSDTPIDDGTIPPTGQSWSLQTPEEAKERFGQGMLVPSYAPDNFTLRRIDAAGTEQAMAVKIIFTYASEDRSYMVIEDKRISPTVFAGYESVDINGIEGYVKSDETASDTELRWSADGVQYMIIGNITKEEIVKVARSLQ